MRLSCRLRDLRGTRSLRDIELATIAAGHKVSGGVLSQIERGIMLPTDEQLHALEHAYGAPAEQWYSRLALRAIQEDTEAA